MKSESIGVVMLKSFFHKDVKQRCVLHKVHCCDFVYGLVLLLAKTKMIKKIKISIEKCKYKVKNLTR